MSRVANAVSLLLNCLILLGLIGFFQVVSAQNSANPSGSTHDNEGTKQPGPLLPSASVSSTQRSTPGPDSPPPLIAPGDEVEVAVYGAPDLSMHSRVSADGNISMPLVGYVRLAGLSSSQAEGAIEDQLRHDNILNNPHVSVYIKEYTGSGISVTGEVARPGVYSALGPHRLFDILQDAGGLTEKAADSVIISHSGSDNPITVELPNNPEALSRLNVQLLPGDTVVVPKAGIVYVLGSVLKPGGYVLNAASGATLLRVIAAAGGPTEAAALGKAKMLRRTGNGLQQLPLPLKKLLGAKVPDVPVQADDIIYIPSSHLKEILNAGALISTAGAAAIYRIP